MKKLVALVVALFMTTSVVAMGTAQPDPEAGAPMIMPPEPQTRETDRQARDAVQQAMEGREVSQDDIPWWTQGTGYNMSVGLNDEWLIWSDSLEDGRHPRYPLRERNPWSVDRHSAITVEIRPQGLLQAQEEDGRTVGNRYNLGLLEQLPAYGSDRCRSSSIETGQRFFRSFDAPSSYDYEDIVFEFTGLEHDTHYCIIVTRQPVLPGEGMGRAIVVSDLIKTDEAPTLWENYVSPTGEWQFSAPTYTTQTSVTTVCWYSIWNITRPERMPRGLPDVPKGTDVEFKMHALGWHYGSAGYINDTTGICYDITVTLPDNVCGQAVRMAFGWSRPTGVDLDYGEAHDARIDVIFPCSDQDQS